ncbi:MAG: TIR domain-containing protein [Parasphingorhabdus sp.]|uniref:TIR domain-containing protein n=1 Tax=Parasphingorhabdus sp. TaxID=2709688 RepID=UPI0032982549
MGKQSATQLFISHHSSKLPIALELEKSLAKYGVTCWLAPRDVEPSEAFDMAIKRAIDESCATLLLFCSKSDKSPHVKRELILADSSRKAIIPVRLEELAPDELAYHLASSQWIDWLEKRESTIERVAAKAHQLAGTVQKTMTVDDLIEHSGNGESESQASPANADSTENHDQDRAESTTDSAAIKPAALEAEPEEQLLAASDPEPETEAETFHDDEDEWETEQPKANVALFVTLAALFVAGVAGFLIWSTMSNEEPMAVANPVDPIENMGTEPGAVEPEDPPVDAPVEPVAPPPDAPSFDCAKATQRVEYLICDTPQLAKLDRTLSTVYKKAMAAAGPNAPRLQKQQRAWRTDIRDACADTQCVATSVRERLAILRAIAAGNLDVPRNPPAPGFSAQFNNSFSQDPPPPTPSDERAADTINPN